MDTKQSSNLPVSNCILSVNVMMRLEPRLKKKLETFLRTVLI